MVKIGVAKGNKDDINGFVIFNPKNPNQTATKIKIAITAIKKYNCFVIWINFNLTDSGCSKKPSVATINTTISWFTTEKSGGIAWLRLCQWTIPDEAKNNDIKTYLITSFAFDSWVESLFICNT